MAIVLIAEDEYLVRVGLRTCLDWERHGFILLDDAVNGEDAYQKILRHRPDILLLDIKMPRMDGFALTKAIRESGSMLPILMLTAKDMPQDKHTGFIVGTDDYMTKPPDRQELVLRIKALLRRAKIASERRIVVGDVVLDYDCLTVSRKGEVQELPQKEFLLLYKLLSYPGKIFTRIQLMDEIWGADSDTGWETVTVHVGRLRKRFQDWPEFTIESVRGLGYKAVKKV